MYSTGLPSSPRPPISHLLVCVRQMSLMGFELRSVSKTPARLIHFSKSELGVAFTANLIKYQEGGRRPIPLLIIKLTNLLDTHATRKWVRWYRISTKWWVRVSNGKTRKKVFWVMGSNRVNKITAMTIIMSHHIISGNGNDGINIFNYSREIIIINLIH